MSDPTWTPYSPDQQSGHQGDASRDAEPGRRALIPRVTQLLHDVGSHGVTMGEACAILERPHQSVSSVLSNLHRTGVAVRLSERRNGCGVYVLPELAGDRPQAAYRRHSKTLTEEDYRRIIQDWAFNSDRGLETLVTKLLEG